MLAYRRWRARAGYTRALSAGNRSPAVLAVDDLCRHGLALVEVDVCSVEVFVVSSVNSGERRPERELAYLSAAFYQGDAAQLHEAYTIGNAVSLVSQRQPATRRWHISSRLLRVKLSFEGLSRGCTGV